jgi:uroporphyrinogen decarboxylase
MPLMTPRQRVLAAFNHCLPDRVPIELGTTRASGISTLAYEHLKRYLGLKTSGETVIRFSQVTLPSEDVLQRFGVDCRPIMVGTPCRARDVELPNGVWQDEWGVQRIKPEGSYYYDLYRSPLADETITIAELHTYSWPDPDDPGRVSGLAERYRYLRERTSYAVLLHLGAELALQAQYLRGFELWFTDLLIRRDFADALLDIILDYQLRYAERILGALPGDVDIIYLVDDIATQNGLMISPSLYRSYLKPRQKKLINFLKSRSDAKILLHLCGSIVDIMDDLIEIGVDGINPVQVSAKGMEPESLKSRWGDRMVFWGAVDTQHLLPNGSPKEIANEVHHLIRVLGENGGFVLGPCHNIQPDVPPQNICALYEAALTYQQGTQG